MGQVRLARDIVSVLALKLMVLSALYFAFFSADRRPAIDARAVARHLLSSEPSR
jgi:hypothetical protein